MKRLPVAARTKRLSLRLTEPGDAPLMLAVLNDPDFVANVGDRGVRSLDQARGYLERGAIASHAERGLGVYRLGIAANDPAIGICGLFSRPWLADPDVGFALLPDHRGRGYALEATEAVLALGFELLDLPRIAAIVGAGNAGSVRVLERAGMTFAGLVRPDGEQASLELFVKARP